MNIVNETVVSGDLQGVMNEGVELSTSRWGAQLDVAVWLGVLSPIHHPLTLAMNYKDKTGEHSVEIDAVVGCNSNVLLLNNRVSVSAVGPVSDVYLRLVSEAETSTSVLEVNIKKSMVTASEYLRRAA